MRWKYGLLFIAMVSCQSKMTQEERPVQVNPPPANSESPVAPEISNPELPPVIKSAKVIKQLGIILGPGASHAYAHIGFLKALSEEKIPVRHIAGVEWGALPAYFFAHEGMGHEVEWKMSRVNPEELFEKGFFGSGKSQFQSRKFLDELEKLTKGQLVQNSKIKFVCPLLQLSTQRLLLNTQGTAKDVLGHCLSYPPFKMANRDLLSDTMNIESLAAALRAKGADFIIYVNVTDGLFIDEFDEESNVKLLWAQTLSQNRVRNIPGVNYIIRPKLSPTKLTEFSKKKAHINEAYTQSKKLLKDLVKNYQF